MEDRFRRLRAVTIGTRAGQGRGGRAAGRPPPLVPVIQPAVDLSDTGLFRAEVSDASPLPDTGRVLPSPPRVRPLPLQRWADDRAALADSLSDTVAWEFDNQTGEQLAFKRDGVSPLVFRKLRRGHWILQGEIDLHGMTREEARVHLAAFLSECTRRGARCIRVIHGKGLRSRNREPVLKSRVAHWLAQRDEVLAFCEATPRDGGGGALFVLLKARER
ncbi:MAG: Smr/MutS family protein [bacterium]